MALSATVIQEFLYLHFSICQFAENNACVNPHFLWLFQWKFCLFLFVVCLGREEEFPISQQSVCLSSFSSFRHGKSATTTTALRGIVERSLLIQDITPPPNASQTLSQTTRGLRNNSEHPRQWRCHRVEFWCCCWFDCDTQNLLQRWRVLTLAQPLKAWTSHTLTFCSPFLTVGCSESARATRTNLWHVKVLKENSVRFTLMEKPKIAHSGKKTMMIARFVSVV